MSGFVITILAIIILAPALLVAAVVYTIKWRRRIAKRRR